MNSDVTFVLPWPPSVNHYWRRRGHIMHISEQGRAYREEVLAAVSGLCERMTGRLAVSIIANPPDRRARDLDNLLKGTLDSMTHAGVWNDDGQIDDLRIRRGDVTEGGELVVNVRELPQA